MQREIVKTLCTPCSLCCKEILVLSLCFYLSNLFLATFLKILVFGGTSIGINLSDYPFADGWPTYEMASRGLWENLM